MIVLVLALGRTTMAASLPPVHLRTDWRAEPALHEVTAVDTTRFVLSWQLQQGTNLSSPIVQSTFEAQILSANGQLLWTSGSVLTAAQEVTAEPVPELPAEASFTWRVRVSCDGNVSMSPWSKLKSFETAPSAASWSGSSWIGGHTFGMLRSDLSLPSAATVRRARAYVTAAGAYILYVNGRRVGRNVMEPGQTTYDRRILYNIFDVTEHLQQAPSQGLQATHVVGALLGNSKYGYMDVWCNITATTRAAANASTSTSAAEHPFLCL